MERFLRRLKYCRPLIFLILFSYLWVMVSFDVVSAQTNVSIPAGTTVNLEITQMLSPDYTYVSDKVNLRVTSDVIVNDVVVIKTGAMAKAVVMEAESRGMIGKAAKITISLQKVEAVDGTMIPIQGMKYAYGADKMVQSVLITVICCVLGLLIKGGDAVIPAGTPIHAETKGTVEVTIN